MNFLEHIDVVPDHPKEGINFYDIQSLLMKPDVWSALVEQLSQRARDVNAEVIWGIESRGFITGMPVAMALGLPFVMVRKAGKLPGEVVAQDYALEYGTDTIEIQKAVLGAGTRVAIMDDLLATGGTMKATGDLVRKVGAEIALASCVIELPELGGRKRLDFAFEAVVQAPLDPFASPACSWVSGRGSARPKRFRGWRAGRR